MSVPCKIVLADDHTLFRNGLRTLLGGIEGFEVVAEASNGLELLELLERSLPDVVLLDIEMPKMNGIAAAEEALRRWPGLKIITLSMYGDEDYYFRMVSLGVKGFILKNSDIKDVVAAIEAVVDAVIAANPDEVARYKDGNTKVIGFFVGQCMKQMRGQGNPKVINQLLAKKLAE